MIASIAEFTLYFGLNNRIKLKVIIISNNKIQMLFIIVLLLEDDLKVLIIQIVMMITAEGKIRSI